MHFIKSRIIKIFVSLIFIQEFLVRIEEIKNEDNEVPADFENEIHKWALECE